MIRTDCSPHGAATDFTGLKEGEPRESLEVRLIAILPKVDSL